MLQEAQRGVRAQEISVDDTIIKTTLYDLVEAVSETVNSNDDHFISGIAKDMLIAGNAKYLNTWY